MMIAMAMQKGKCRELQGKRTKERRKKQFVLEATGHNDG
jgi:hypothetical protein